jgi:hypothetical protein
LPPARRVSGLIANPTTRFAGSKRSTKERKGAALKRMTGATRLRSRPAQRRSRVDDGEAGVTCGVQL